MAQMPLHSDTLPPVGDALPEAKIGDMLGNYRLDAVAGEGGMGRVFCATHTKLDKRVAVKILRRRYSRRAESIARFFQEARAVNVIRHPNIVEITDFVEGPQGGDSYYIMEWLEGCTLAARLQREKTLPIDLVIHIGRQVASALAAVHKGGFVHRDLKPDNVFLIQHEGRTDAKILDFGVAMLQGPTDGAVAGTPAYFSPEGAAGRALDGRSDIYSLGVMLYELLAGIPPFQASSLSEYVMKHMTAQPRPLPEVVPHPLPPELIATIERCLAKNPEDRFQSMDELEAALAVLADDQVASLPTRGMPWRAIALGALAVMALATVTTRLLRHGAMQQTREPDRGQRATPDGQRVTVPTPRAPEPVHPIEPVTPPTPQPAPPPIHATEPVRPAVPLVKLPEPAGQVAVPTLVHAAEPSPVHAVDATAADLERTEMKAFSEPSGAEVYRDGVLLGVTPCALRLPAGRQSLVFKKATFKPKTLTIDPRAGGTINARLTPHAGPASHSPSEAPNRGGTINPFE